MGRKRVKDSGFVGVYFNNTRHAKGHPKGRHWFYKIKHDDKVHRRGQYPTPREAALARDKHIIELGSTEPLQVLKRK